jgi:hypothetical protein
MGLQWDGDDGQIRLDDLKARQRRAYEVAPGAVGFPGEFIEAGKILAGHLNRQDGHADHPRRAGKKIGGHHDNIVMTAYTGLLGDPASLPR